MKSGVREYIEACSVCARNKTSSGSRMGLLHPLPIPSRPWSDISMDFVTGLPASKENTTVLTVVDRFSKMTHFIAMPKLPSSKETAEAMMNQVFRIHGSWYCRIPSANAMVRRCHCTWATARQVLVRQGDRVKGAADRRRRPAPVYQPGQNVWLSAKHLHLKVPSPKLAPRFVGPFPISRVISPAAIRLRLPRSLRVHPTFRVSQVKPTKDSSMVPQSKTPPPLEATDGGLQYKVRKLLVIRNQGRGKQFLVDWEGYGPEERQWVPRSHIDDPSLIQDFFAENQVRPGQVSVLEGGVFCHDPLSSFVVYYVLSRHFLFYFEISTFPLVSGILPFLLCHVSDCFP